MCDCCAGSSTRSATSSTSTMAGAPSPARRTRPRRRWSSSARARGDSFAQAANTAGSGCCNRMRRICPVHSGCSSASPWRARSSSSSCASASVKRSRSRRSRARQLQRAMAGKPMAAPPRRSSRRRRRRRSSRRRPGWAGATGRPLMRSHGCRGNHPSQNSLPTVPLPTPCPPPPPPGPVRKTVQRSS